MTENQMIEKALLAAGYPATLEVDGAVHVYCENGPEALAAVAQEFGRSVYPGQTEGVYVL